MNSQTTSKPTKQPPWQQTRQSHIASFAGHWTCPGRMYQYPVIYITHTRTAISASLTSAIPCLLRQTSRTDPTRICAIVEGVLHLHPLGAPGSHEHELTVLSVLSVLFVRAFLARAQARWMKKVVEAIQNGDSVIMENCPQGIDASLNPVLQVIPCLLINSFFCLHVAMFRTSLSISSLP